MAVGTGSQILASDHGANSGQLITAADINMRYGSSVSTGSLIYPIGNQYAVQDGNWIMGHSSKHNPYSFAHKNDANGSHIYLSTYQGGSNAYILCWWTPAITFYGQWKYLILDSNQSGDNSYYGLMANPSRDNANSIIEPFVISYKVMSRRSSWTGRKTMILDVSGITSGTYYLTVKLKSWIEVNGTNVTGTAGEMRMYNFYLSH